MPISLRSLLTVAGALALSLPLMTPSIASAQEKQHRLSKSAQLGGDPYERYTRPGHCEQAGNRHMAFFWRANRPDTVLFAPATDSIPKRVVDEVRACLARFSIDNVADRELLDLGQAYLMAQQDELAEAAFTKLLNAPAQKDPVQKGWVLQLIVDSYRDAKPTRLAQSQKYLAQLDAMGDTVALWRLFAHTGAAGYAMSVNELETSQSEARAALKASAKMQRNDRLDFLTSIFGAYNTLAEPVAIVQKSGKPSIAIFDTALVDLLPLRPEGSREQQGVRGMIENAKAPYTLFGEQGQPLKADQWFEAEVSSEGAMANAARPKPGKVSLIIFSSPNCGGNCYPMYASIRRLNAQFGDQVEIIFLSQFTGYFRNKLQTPEEETASTSKYFHEFLELPITIGIENRTFGKRPDGRLIRPPTENLRNYVRGRSAIIVGKDGVILPSAAVLGPNREMAWKAIIQQALQ